MTTAEFLRELKRLDIEVRVSGDRLTCNAPQGVMTDELREQLRLRKAEILAFMADARNLAQQQEAIVPLKAGGDELPVYAVPGHNGDVFCYRWLTQHLAEGQPLFGLQPPGVDGTRPPLASVDELAAYFARQILAARPNGPVIIAGFCAGGSVAFDLARRLREAGQPVEMLTLFGAPFPTAYRFPSQVRIRGVHLLERIGVHLRKLWALPVGEKWRYLAGRILHWTSPRRMSEEGDSDPVHVLRRRVEEATLQAIRTFDPKPFDGRVFLALPSERWRRIGDNSGHWRRYAASYREFVGPDGCTGDDMLQEPYVQTFAEVFRAECASAAAVGASPQSRVPADPKVSAA